MERRSFIATMVGSLSLAQETVEGFSNFTLPQAKPTKSSELDFVNGLPKEAEAKVAVKTQHADGTIVGLRHTHLPPGSDPLFLLSVYLDGPETLHKIVHSQTVIKDTVRAMRQSLGDRFQVVALEGVPEGFTQKILLESQQKSEAEFARMLDKKEKRNNYADFVKANADFLAQQLKNISKFPEDQARALRVVETWTKSMTDILALWEHKRPEALQKLTVLHDSMWKALDNANYLPDLGIRIISGESAELHQQAGDLWQARSEARSDAEKANIEAKLKQVMELREDFAVQSAARATTKQRQANVVGIIFGSDHDFVNNVTNHNKKPMNPKLNLVTAGTQPSRFW